MAIEDILSTLEEQAQGDIDAVLAEARHHAEHILSEAQREAERIRDGHVNQAERHAHSEAAKRVNAARLQAKMLVSTERGRAVETVFESAMLALRDVRGSDEYPALFASLAAEALDGLGGDVELHVDPAYVALASSVSAPGVSVSVVPDLSTSGGVIVEGWGGRLVRRNTLEDRVERSRRLLQADLAKALFA